MIQIWGELPRLETEMILPSGVHEGMDPDPGSTTLPVPSSRTVNSFPSAPLITRRPCCAVGGEGGGGLAPEPVASASARTMMMIFISILHHGVTDRQQAVETRSSVPIRHGNAAAISSSALRSFCPAAQPSARKISPSPVDPGSKPL